MKSRKGFDFFRAITSLDLRPLIPSFVAEAVSASHTSVTTYLPCSTGGPCPRPRSRFRLRPLRQKNECPREREKAGVPPPYGWKPFDSGRSFSRPVPMTVPPRAALHLRVMRSNTRAARHLRPLEGENPSYFVSFRHLVKDLAILNESLVKVSLHVSYRYRRLFDRSTTLKSSLRVGPPRERVQACSITFTVASAVPEREQRIHGHSGDLTGDHQRSPIRCTYLRIRGRRSHTAFPGALEPPGGMVILR